MRFSTRGELLNGFTLVYETNFTIKRLLGPFPSVRTECSYHSRLNENFINKSIQVSRQLLNDMHGVDVFFSLAQTP